jgi:hypothetical protein
MSKTEMGTPWTGAVFAGKLMKISSQATGSPMVKSNFTAAGVMIISCLLSGD